VGRWCRRMTIVARGSGCCLERWLVRRTAWRREGVHLWLPALRGRLVAGKHPDAICAAIKGRCSRTPPLDPWPAGPAWRLKARLPAVTARGLGGGGAGATCFDRLRFVPAGELGEEASVLSVGDPERRVFAAL